VPGVFVLVLLGVLAIAGVVSKQLFNRQVALELGSKAVRPDGATEYRLNLSQASRGLTIDSVPRDCPGCATGGGANITVVKPPKSGQIELIATNQPADNWGAARKSTDLMYTARAGGGEPDEFTYRIWSSRTDFVERRVVVNVR
jgi:hypothetical protein